MNDENDDIAIEADALADATCGDAETQAYVGICYTHGWDGFPVDNERALAWIQRAGAQRNADGQYNLAYLYETGEGVPQDEDEAYRLYSLAAAQGHEAANERLNPRPRKKPSPVLQ